MSDSSPAGRAGRREARERAVELSYEAQARSWTAGEVVDSLLVAPEPFAVALLNAVESKRDEIDGLIGSKARGWTLDRMATIDLIVMRLAVAELLTKDTPTGVVLSEAVALAGLYSTDESSRFVNGVLASIAADVRTT